MSKLNKSTKANGMEFGGYGKMLLLFHQLEKKGLIKLCFEKIPVNEGYDQTGSKLMVKLTAKGKEMETKDVEHPKQPAKKKAQKGKKVAVKGKVLKAMTKTMGKVKLASKPKENKLATKGKKKNRNKKKKGKEGKAVKV